MIITKLRIFGVGHQGRGSIETMPEIDFQPTLCTYSHECGKVCPIDRDCQVKKFYDRYGVHYREMGVGA